MLEVHAEWDDEAGVWVATSDDVLGLVTEAPSMEALVERLKIIIPELMALNGGSVATPLRFHLTGERTAVTQAA